MELLLWVLDARFHFLPYGLDMNAHADKRDIGLVMALQGESQKHKLISPKHETTTRTKLSWLSTRMDGFRGFHDPWERETDCLKQVQIKPKGKICRRSRRGVRVILAYPLRSRSMVFCCTEEINSTPSLLASK